MKFAGVSVKPTKVAEPPPPPPLKSVPTSQFVVDELYFNTEPLTAPDVSTSPMFAIESIAPATDALP